MTIYGNSISMVTRGEWYTLAMMITRMIYKFLKKLVLFVQFVTHRVFNSFFAQMHKACENVEEEKQYHSKLKVLWLNICNFVQDQSCTYIIFAILAKFSKIANI